MSKRFRSLKKEFKDIGLKNSNRDIRKYLHYIERIKITDRFIKRSNRR